MRSCPLSVVLEQSDSVQEAAKQKQTLSSEEKQSIQAPILEAQDAAEAAQDQKSEGPTMSLNMVRFGYFFVF